MKKIFPYILGFSIFFLLGIGGRSAVDYIRCQQYIDVVSSAAPSVSASGEARIYVDSTTKSLSYSVNGNNFVTLAATTPPQKQNYIINGDGALALRYGIDGTVPSGGGDCNVLSANWVTNTTDLYICDRWKVGASAANGCIGAVANPYSGYQISTKSLTTNVASITIRGKSIALAGETYTVALNPSDAIFDGARTVLVSNGAASIITYNDTNANVGSTGTGGNIRELGLISNTYMGIRQLSGSNKIMMYQPIEAAMTQQLRGKQVIVQFKAKGTAGTLLNSAIIEDSTAPSNLPALTWPNPLVNTWGANGTDPTFNTATNSYSFSYVAPSLSSGGSLVRSCSQQTLGVDWVQYYYITTLPTDFYQLGVVFWLDATASGSNNVPFCLTEIGMFDSVELQPYVPRHPQIEKSLCQRYCYSIYNQSSTQIFGFGATANTSTVGQYVQFPVTMRITPTFSMNGTLGHVSCETLQGTSIAAETSVPSLSNTTKDGGVLSYSNTGATWAAGNVPQWIFWNTSTAGDALVFDADY